MLAEAGERCTCIPDPFVQVRESVDSLVGLLRAVAAFIVYFGFLSFFLLSFRKQMGTWLLRQVLAQVGNGFSNCGTLEL